MSARPRPVTATVTKPAWMQVTQADVAVYRRQSLTSNGSTASLTSVLDHDSYESQGEEDSDREEDVPHQPLLADSGDAPAKTAVHFTEQAKPTRRAVKRHTAELLETGSNMRSQSGEFSGLTAWEMWLIQKARDDRQARRQARQQRRQEKLDLMAREREKQMKEMKAEEVRRDWLDRKNQQERLAKKMERLKVNTDLQAKQDERERIRRKADTVFSQWQQAKRQEERKKRLKEKEMKQREEEAQRVKQQEAEEKYQQWLKSLRKRPQSAPSFKAGFNNNAPYPKPGYVNPEPWHHPVIPKVKPDKPKAKARKYVWNPNKYF